MLADAITRIDGFPVSLAPLAEAARSLLDGPGRRYGDGELALGHRPWVAPENYLIRLYPGLADDDRDRYVGRRGLEIPHAYAEFLAAVNGTFCFGISLAGVPRSMLGTPPLLDRSILQCHDLGTAATSWILEYRKVPKGAFHFGGRSFTRRANVGYFFVGARILSLRNSGQVVGEWDNLADFLHDEIALSRSLEAEWYPAPTTES